MYSIRQVSKLLGMKESAIRELARSGFLDADRQDEGELNLSFRDLVLLRSARSLMESRMSAARVRTLLSTLKEQLGEDQPLSSLRIRASGRRVTVQDQQKVWEPESGQYRLNFEAETKPEAPREIEFDEPNNGASAEDWYETACALDSDSLYEAAAAYRRALELDPLHKDAHLNLGRLLHEMGEFAAAEKHYRKALQVDPKDATSSYNLGVVLQDLGREAEAVKAYEKAVTLAPGFKEAHYNLARLYQLEGQHGAAFQHLKTYRQLT